MENAPLFPKQFPWLKKKEKKSLKNILQSTSELDLMAQFLAL